MRLPGCSFLEELKAYAKGGGKLLIIGTETAKLFEKELGIKTLENSEVRSVIYFRW